MHFNDIMDIYIFIRCINKRTLYWICLLCTVLEAILLIITPCGWLCAMLHHTVTQAQFVMISCLWIILITWVCVSACVKQSEAGVLHWQKKWFRLRVWGAMAEQHMTMPKLLSARDVTKWFLRLNTCAARPATGKQWLRNEALKLSCLHFTDKPNMPLDLS